MDVCIVNGAERPGGIALCRLLLDQGFRVYALVDQQQDWGIVHADFVSLETGSADLAQWEAMIGAIVDHEGGIYGLIHLSRQFSAQTFGELETAEVERLIQENLTLPLLITYGQGTPSRWNPLPDIGRWFAALLPPLV